MPQALPRPYTLSWSCQAGQPPRTGDLEGTRLALRTTTPGAFECSIQLSPAQGAQGLS